MTTALEMIVPGLLLLAVVSAMTVRGRVGRVDQVGTFEAAREMTNRWSQDPSSTPKPLRDFVEAERRRGNSEPDAPTVAEDAGSPQ